MSKPGAKTGSLILIVDDDPSIRLLLRRAMHQEGYRTVEADNGETGLELYKVARPDLVLLDALMPIMDGFETCARLQQLNGGTRTPVLMITSLDDSESVDMAFKAGAVDFITKPIHWPVLRQRVSRLLATKQLEEMRDDLTHMIVHDMKNPISSINGYSDLLLNELRDNLTRQQLDAIGRVYRNSNLLLEMTMMILDLKRLEEGRLRLEYSPANVQNMLQQVSDGVEWLAHSRRIKLVIQTENPDLQAILDWNLINRVVANLLTNAIKHSPKETIVTLVGRSVLTNPFGNNEQAKPYLLLAVQDQGEGIAADDQERIFDKFTQAAARKSGLRSDTGLGLTFCKLAVEAHNGAIRLESELGVGSTFTLFFPLEVEDRQAIIE